MTRLASCFIAMLAGALAAADFAPPQAYPRDRYEAGWQKNPFTLKTTPPVVQVDSFAKDLALSSISGTSADPVVVVINTKTHERTTLRSGTAKSEGQAMTIKSIHSDAPRKERFVEVEMAGQVAEIHYDENLIKVASAAAAPGAATNPAMTGGRAGAPNGVVTQPGVVTTLPGQPNAAVNRSAASMNYAKLPANVGMTSAAPPPMTTNTGVPAGVTVPVVPGQPAGSNPAEAAPFVQRRRFSGVPQPVAPSSPQPAAPVNP